MIPDELVVADDFPAPVDLAAAYAEGYTASSLPEVGHRSPIFTFPISVFFAALLGVFHVFAVRALPFRPATMPTKIGGEVDGRHDGIEASWVLTPTAPQLEDSGPGGLGLSKVQRRPYAVRRFFWQTFKIDGAALTASTSGTTARAAARAL